METQLTLHRASRQNDSPIPSGGLSEIQASCRRVADAADAEVNQALGDGLEAEEFLQSTKQVRGGQ
jgi:hypothetical protein